MSDLETIKSKFEALRPLMDERMCRLWAACEARPLGHGGRTRVAAATGLDPKTIRRGLKELELLPWSGDAGRQEGPPFPPVVPRGRVRRPGGGAKPTEVKDPGILAALE